LPLVEPDGREDGWNGPGKPGLLSTTSARC